MILIKGKMCDGLNIFKHTEVLLKITAVHGAPLLVSNTNSKPSKLTEQITLAANAAWIGRLSLQMMG